MHIFIVLLGLFLWLIIGCGVCAFIDDNERRLYHWAGKAPLGLSILVPLFWPFVVYFWYKGE